MSVLELSRRSGVARNTIAALERGEGNPTVDTLYALCDALGVSLSANAAVPLASVFLQRLPTAADAALVKGLSYGIAGQKLHAGRGADTVERGRKALGSGGASGGHTAA